MTPKRPGTTSKQGRKPAMPINTTRATTSAMTEKLTDPMLNVIPLGGLGEIGLNMMVIECEDTIVIVDSG